MKRFITLTLMLLFIASSVSAFDGMRRGFVIGGGIGFSADSKWSTKVLGFNIEESGSGSAGNFLIGYGWDEYNMIVADANVAIYKTSLFEPEDITQGFSGVAWYRYFGEKGSAFFTALGLGQYVFEVSNLGSNVEGLGFLLGAGYEFSPHFQAAFYFNSGQTKDGGFDFEHTSLNIIVSGVAF